jgi:hypothetical protein
MNSKQKNNSFSNWCSNIIKPNDIISNTIPKRLKDESLICTKNNTSLFFIFCVIIRIVLGILVFNKKISNMTLYILSIFIIIVFSYKFLTYKKTWKNYPRTIISYILIIIFTYINNDKNNYNMAGIIMLFDVLSGIESRYIANNILF